MLRLLMPALMLAVAFGTARAQTRHFELGAYLSQYDICGLEEPVGMASWKMMKDADGAAYLDTIAVNLDYYGIPWNGRPQWFEESIIEYADWLRDQTSANVMLHTRPLQRLDWMPAPGVTPTAPRYEVYPPRTCSIPADAPAKYAEYVRWVTQIYSDRLGDRLKYVVHAAESNSFWDAKIDEYERSGDPACLESHDEYHAMLDAAYDSIKSVDPRISAFPSFKIEELYGLSYESEPDRFRSCWPGQNQQECALANIALAASLKRDKFGVAFQPYVHAHSDYSPADPFYDEHYMYDDVGEVFTGVDWLGAGAMQNEGIVIAETAWNATEVKVHRSIDPVGGFECWDNNYASEAESPRLGVVDFYTSGNCVPFSWPYGDPDEPIGSDTEQSDFFNGLIAAAQENPNVELITWWSIRDQIDTAVASREGIAPDLGDTSCAPIRWDNQIHGFRHSTMIRRHERYGTPYSSPLASFGEATLKIWSTVGLLDYFGNDVGRSLRNDWLNVQKLDVFHEATEPAMCFDGIDNDLDQASDCDDPNCRSEPGCIQLELAEQAPSWAEISSPDGRLHLTLKHLYLGGVAGRYPQGRLLYYRLQRDGATVLDWSPLGLQLDGADLAFDLQYVETKYTALSDSYTLVHGKSSAVTYDANEALITALGAGGQPLLLRLRVFDDGIAFRYELLGSGTVTVASELSAFSLPAGSIGHLADAVAPSPYQPGYESVYSAQVAGSPGQGDGFYLPALFTLPDGATHLLLHEAGLYESYAGTRLDSDASDRVYQLRLPSAGEGDPLEPTNPEMTLPATTPWRVVMVGSLADIVASNLVTHLSLPLDAAFAGDTSWVLPGKAAWSWWSQGTGSPELQREYIDSAAEFGWEYVIVDADWSLWPGAEGEIQALVQYAAQRGVKIILWYNSGGANNAAPFEPRDRLNDTAAMQAEFTRLAAWGVAGIKVDFFRSDKQARIEQYRSLLRTAAENRLQVVLHGSTPPRGWRREFPNLLTSEAVLGGEHYLWDLGPDAAHNVSLVFTRNVVGAMDYTPLGFAEALSEKGISYAHQLALSVAFESALQAFADRADADAGQGFRALFGQFPFVQDFLDDLPTAWEDTRLLEGSPLSHAVVARKRDGRWYIAGLNAELSPRRVSIDLSDLASGQYQAELIQDGVAAELLHSYQTLSDQQPFEVTMAPFGGFVLVVNLGWEESPWRFDPFDGPWRKSPWLGYVNDYWGPWVQQREHGWLLVLNSDPDDLLLQTEQGDLWWTSRSDYPYIFDVAREHWLFYIRDSVKPRLFYNTTLDAWESR